jgi:hypothetical protein
MMDVPAPHAAAIAGDEFQHAYTFTHAMNLLKEDRGIVGIGIEVSNAGNVDDLVIRRTQGPPSFQQVKFVASQRKLLTHEWLTKVPAGSRKSILRRFYESFAELTDGGVRPEMALITNRRVDGNDPLLRYGDGRDGKIMPRASDVSPRSDAGKALAAWAEHLGITRGDLDEMLRHLEIRTDVYSLATLKEQCRLSLESCGYYGGPEAVTMCIGAVRELVIAGKGRHSDVDRAEWERILNRLNLALGEPSATLVVQVIDAHPGAATATASLDWRDRFQPGGRVVIDPADWMGRLWPELEAATAVVRDSGRRPVALMGSVRLSTGFATGFLLPARAQIELIHDSYDQTWSTIGDMADVSLDVRRHEVGQGDQLAVGLSTTGDLSADVMAYINQASLPVGTLLEISPAGGPGPQSLPNPAVARGWADKTMRAIREASRDCSDPIHLFQYGPLFAAILLGSVWNRMPETQLYDDAPPAYTPTYKIPPT